MKLVFYSVVLNQHQAPVADALYELLGNDYCFVELTNIADTKGSTEDFSKRAYMLKAWEMEENHRKALELAVTAECCVFGPQALEYETARMREGLLSFDMGERWLKKGAANIFSPNLIKWHLNYHFRGWKNKPLYKLCMSAFAAGDHRKLSAFNGKCYKWGYFTRVEKFDVEASRDASTSNADATPLMWCARYLMWKHPELPILLAQRLKQNGYKFHLDMYGTGEIEKHTQKLAVKIDVMDCVTFHGQVSNANVIKAMRQHDIFLFTSDRNEGWGAVANEAMSNGCTLVASDAIGAVPYLVQDGVNGLIFENNNLDSLYEKVKFLMENPQSRIMMAKQAYISMSEVWSPQNAAKNLLQLIDDLQNGKETSIENGPCSKA